MKYHASSEENQTLRAEVERLRKALGEAVGAAEYVIALCESNLKAGDSPNPSIKSDWVGTVAHCYAAMSFVGNARAALSPEAQPALPAKCPHGNALPMPEGWICIRCFNASQAIQDTVEDTLSGFVATGEGPYPDELKGACPSCGCEALDHRGLWVCGCSGRANKERK